MSGRVYRDPVGQGRDTLQRIDLLERRLNKVALPARVSPGGQEIVDWDDATSAGFYWAQAGAANAPGSLPTVGEVLPYPVGGMVVQVTHEMDDSGQVVATWRRFRTSSGAWTPWGPIAEPGEEVPPATTTVMGKVMLATDADVTDGTPNKNSTHAVTPDVLETALIDHIVARHGYAMSLTSVTGANDLNTPWQTGFFSADASPLNAPSDMVNSDNMLLILQQAVGETIGQAGQYLGTQQLVWEVNLGTYQIVRSWMRYGDAPLDWGPWSRTDLSWDVIAGKPATFPPSAHTHPWSQITGTPSTYPPSAHTHTASQITDFATAADARVNALVPTATTTVKGKSELATNAETQTGTDASRVVTPASLSSRTATESRTGLAQLATEGEVVDTALAKNATHIVTPAVLATALRNQIAARHGYAIRGTESLNGTPYGQTGFFYVDGLVGGMPSDTLDSNDLFMLICSHAGESLGGAGEDLGTLQMLWEVDSGGDGDVVRSWARFGGDGQWSAWTRTDASWDALSGKPPTFPPSAHTHTASQITDFATAVDARVNNLVPNASTTARGKVELATNAETVAGTDTVRAVTPAGLKAALDALPPGDTQHPGAGDLSIQLGENADALGDFSISVGHNSSSTGTGGVSLGPGATSSGYGSSFGASAEAGDAGSAFGSASLATGAGSAAIGLGTQATHAGSTAVGVGAITTQDHQIMLGTANEEVTIPGPATVQGQPILRIAAGYTSAPSIPAGGYGNITVTFPAGRFTAIPEVTATPSSSIPNQRSCGFGARSTTSFTIRQHNGTGSTSGAAVSWIAIQGD